MDCELHRHEDKEAEKTGSLPLHEVIGPHEAARAVAAPVRVCRVVVVAARVREERTVFGDVAADPRYLVVVVKVRQALSLNKKYIKLITAQTYSIYFIGYRDKICYLNMF